MRRLFPEPAGEASLDQLYGAARPAAPGRPWVGTCMITSLDGSTAVAGTSRGLSNEHDTAVLLRLRDAADVILVGATTARQEGYGPPRQDGQRIGVVTASGNVETSSDLFASGSGFLIMPEDGPPAPPGPAGRSLDVIRAGRGRVDVAAALRRLHELVETPRFVHVEGGPHLNAALLDTDCVDELNLTVSPQLVGGEAARLAVGAAPHQRGFELAHLIIDEHSFVFSRWVRSSPAMEAP
ncbi:MAG: dihydrofolate reductase family protein [Ilumatobacteraceae bacterium]